MGADWVTTSDFWQMAPYEIWWLYDAKKEQVKGADQDPTDWDDLEAWVDTL